MLNKNAEEKSDQPNNKPIQQDNQDSQLANKTRNLLDYMRITLE